MSETRVPAGVPTGGQFAASARAESDVALAPETAATDLAGMFRPEIDALEKRWRNEPDANNVFNGLILALCHRVIAASETDRPGYEPLVEVACELRDQMADSDADPDDTAEEALYRLQDITSQESMRAALTAHDCTGPDDDEAHDALHSAAEHFASEVNNAGKADQVGFLRRMRVGDDEILAALGEDDGLDDLVIDTASTVASAAYNDGGTPDQVTADLESKRWLLAGDKTLVDKHPAALAPGECTDIVIRVDGTPITYRVSYNEWTPLGDNNQPAPGYLRGEFSAESEWAVNEHPVARESSPFRRDRGETAQVSYAWDQFSADLGTAASKSVRKHQNDLVLRRIERD